MALITGVMANESSSKFIMCSDRDEAAFQSDADVGLNAGALLPTAAGQALIPEQGRRKSTGT